MVLYLALLVGQVFSAVKLQQAISWTLVQPSALILTVKINVVLIIVFLLESRLTYHQQKSVVILWWLY